MECNYGWELHERDTQWRGSVNELAREQSQGHGRPAPSEDGEILDSAIPPLPAHKIRGPAAHTSRTVPDDLLEAGLEPSLQGEISFRVEPRSNAILLTEESVVPGES